MASVFWLVLCLILSFSLAVTSVRELASSDLAHQVKSQNARITSRIVLSDPNTDQYESDTIQHAATMGNSSDYYGAKATFSVHELPGVQTKHSSSAGISVVHYDLELNHIEAGWHVNPDLYGDVYTHFFASWTVQNGNQSTGCYNLECSGFVHQSSSRIKPGDILTSVSTYKGEQKYITISIHKGQDGNWWLHFGEGTEVTAAVGYWTKSLFGKLAEKANFIEFGGNVEYPRSYRGPPMGSGHFSEEGEYRAASFKSIMSLDKQNNFQIIMPGSLSNYSVTDTCYNLTKSSDLVSGGLEFYYGGPGGCP